MCGCGKLTIKKLNHKKNLMIQKRRLAQNAQNAMNNKKIDGPVIKINEYKIITQEENKPMNHTPQLNQQQKRRRMQMRQQRQQQIRQIQQQMRQRQQQMRQR